MRETKLKADAKWLNERHEALHGLARKTLALALEIGERLSAVKERTPHGQWQRWVKENLTFDVRTAQRYLSIHDGRGVLAKHDSVSLLTEAYALLVSVRGHTKPAKPEPEPEAPAPEPLPDDVLGLLVGELGNSLNKVQKAAQLHPKCSGVFVGILEKHRSDVAQLIKDVRAKHF